MSAFKRGFNMDPGELAVEFLTKQQLQLAYQAVTLVEIVELRAFQTGEDAKAIGERINASLKLEYKRRIKDMVANLGATEADLHDVEIDFLHREAGTSSPKDDD